MSQFKKPLITYFLFFAALISTAQIPDYYNTIDFNQSGEALKIQLADLITDTHIVFLPYTSTSLDTWDVIQNSDLDPDNTQNVLLVYGYSDTDDDFQTGRSRDKDSNCTSNQCVGLWNREHIFARSLANPSLDVSFPSAGTDVHNLRSCDSQMNSSRSNRLFAAGNGNATITPQGHFYPGDEWKGDIARIIMYMYLRYPNQCLANYTAFSSNTYSQDMPDIFLEWNAQDPVSNLEIQRNNVIEASQGNRNPFIDNPYLATQIWGGMPAPNTWNVLNITEPFVSEISIYPNPTASTLYLDCNTSCPLQAIIYNLEGKIIQSINNPSSIDVSSLQSGYYILKLNQIQSSTYTRFLKN